MPLPDPVVCGKCQANELDRKRYILRKKQLKEVEKRCEKMPNLELRGVLDEMGSIVDILEKLEKEVKLNKQLILGSLKDSEYLFFS